MEGTIRGFIEKAFWCCVIGVGHLLHRLVEPYQRLPWALARLVDKRCRDADKAAIAAWFMGLHDCCLDEGFSAKVRRMATGGSVDLLPGGRLHLQLKSSFHSKNTNMTVENNFARAQTAQCVARGNSGQASSLSARHMLAECKRLHVRDVTLSARGGYVQPTSDALQADMSAVPDQYQVVARAQQREQSEQAAQHDPDGPSENKRKRVLD